MKNEFEELVRLLRGHRVIIQTHDFPDPDAIATACGLKALLDWKGIPSEITYFGRIEKINTKLILDMFHIEIQNAEKLTDLSEEVYVVTVDGQKDNSNFTDLLGTEVACIDHHPLVTQYEYPFMKHCITGACATIVTRWIMESGMHISKELATILLYGIKMDTRYFSVGVTHEDILAFDFLNGIADNDYINNLENSVLELSDLRAYGAAIENITVFEEVGFSYIPFPCPDGLIASVSEFILSLAAVKVAIVYADRNGGLKFSVRSIKPGLNAGRLLNTALKGIGSGGGHIKMAGGVIFAERMPLLGDPHLRESVIRDRVMNAYHDMMKPIRFLKTYEQRKGYEDV